MAAGADPAKEAVRRLFEAGQVHPACPGCGGGSFEVAAGAVRRPPDGRLWRAYRCDRCGEGFGVTV